MNDKLSIYALPDPEDYIADMGEMALFGLYIRVWWQYSELLKSNTDLLSENLEGGVHPNYSKAIDVVTNTESAYEQWLAMADEQLPEWATEIVQEIELAVNH